MNVFKMFSKEAMKNNYNMTSFWLGMDHYTVVVEPNLFELFSKECLEKTRFAKFARSLIGNGSIFAPVDIWRPKRKHLAPTFSTKNLNNFCNIFSQQSLILVERLQSTLTSEKFSMWPFITTYTMDSVCETVLGIQIHAQTDKEQPFLKALNEYLTVGSSRIFKPWLYIKAIYKLHPDSQILRRTKKTIWEFVSNIIEKKREDIKRTKSKEASSGVESTESFLDLLLESADGVKFTNHYLIEEMLVLLLAGTDTSAVGAGFTCVMLSKYPDVQMKVYEERPILHTDLPKLKYLHAVVKETLRLYPPVPIIGRAVEKDVLLLILSIWGMHHNPKLWGDDVESFIPERFLNGSVPSGAFAPFSDTNTP
ncbi:unnamed protein product [Leptidea sinapis]|uniref:Cytochrome P450 n=1 Tax=Leptidea sinapis TaxID=189913 RepID=A0A5E4Q3X9_9NEOP|nr:unnamed protein product [Leptidea sinapis]